jgi:hypothetical protein
MRIHFVAERIGVLVQYIEKMRVYPNSIQTVVVDQFAVGKLALFHLFSNPEYSGNVVEKSSIISKTIFLKFSGTLLFITAKFGYLII